MLPQLPDRNCSTQELLAHQFAAMQSALAYHREIATRLQEHIGQDAFKKSGTADKLLQGTTPRLKATDGDEGLDASGGEEDDESPRHDTPLLGASDKHESARCQNMGATCSFPGGEWEGTIEREGSEERARSKDAHTIGIFASRASSRKTRGRNMRKSMVAAMNMRQSTTESAETSAKSGKGNIFADADSLKQKVVEQLSKPSQTVESLYKTDGCWQALARSETFQNIAIAVVILNVLWIAVDTDYNKSENENVVNVLHVVNNLFCGTFVAEILVRFMAFKNKRDCLSDYMFTFDAVLVAFMVYETWGEVLLLWAMGSNSSNSKAASFFRVFRILRLTRVARLARVLRHVPELMILIKGMVLATKPVAATLGLLFVIIYVFAIVFTQQLAGTEEGKGCFDTVPEAIYCLVNNGVFSQQGVFIDKMFRASWLIYCITLFFLLLTSLTVLNMLIGVLCEVISVTAKVHNEEVLLNDLKTQIPQLMPDLDVEGNAVLTRETFAVLMENPATFEALHNVGVDVLALIDFADYIFHEQDELRLSDLILQVLQFRGTKAATVKDIVDMRMFLSSEFRAFQMDVDERLLHFEKSQLGQNEDVS